MSWVIMINQNHVFILANQDHASLICTARIQTYIFFPFLVTTITVNLSLLDLRHKIIECYTKFLFHIIFFFIS